MNQQPLDLLRGKYLHLSGLGERETAAVRGIAEDELFRNRFVQCCMESGVDAPNSLVGKTFAIEFGPEKPAILLEIGVELLDVVGSQLVQLDAAQFGDDVLINAPLIGHLGIGAEV